MVSTINPSYSMGLLILSFSFNILIAVLWNSSICFPGSFSGSVAFESCFWNSHSSLPVASASTLLSCGFPFPSPGFYSCGLSFSVFAFIAFWRSFDWWIILLWLVTFSSHMFFDFRICSIFALLVSRFCGTLYVVVQIGILHLFL